MSSTWSESPSCAPDADAGDIEFNMSADGKTQLYRIFLEFLIIFRSDFGHLLLPPFFIFLSYHPVRNYTILPFDNRRWRTLNNSICLLQILLFNAIIIISPNNNNKNVVIICI